MKILHLNTFNNNSGASIAAKRLIEAQNLNDINSVLLYSKGLPNSKYYKKLNCSTINQVISYLESFLNIINGSYKGFNSNLLSASGVLKEINRINPDIVHLHWIHGGFISVEILKKIKQPIVMTLHDMWAFTGGCHYNGNCFNFNTGCENCHMLNAVTKRDLSFYNAKRKRSLYAKNKISFIAPSTWMLQEGLRSALLKNQRIVHIPNAFNAKKYPLLNRKECREKLNLSINKSLVIFGAINPEDDPRKGYKHVKNCLTYLKDDSKIKFAIFGSETSRSNEFKNFGFIESELKMREILSAADCVIVPSEQENLSNLIIESMSCGTPVVAFDIGGNDNIINHKSNGYLAKPFDSKDLASGIKFILKTKIDQSVCRKKIEKDFNYERIAKMHSEFYNELVS